MAYPSDPVEVNVPPPGSEATKAVDAATGTLRAQLETEKRLLANAQDELESVRGELEAWEAEVAKQASRVAEIESALEALRD